MSAPLDHPALVRPYFWMLLSSFCFALMSTLAHAAGQHCNWQVVAIARSGMALVFAASLAVSARRPVLFRYPAVLWMRSVAGSVSLLCGFYAITHMPVADALTLSNMYPLWVAMLSWPVLGDFPRAGVWFAAGCGILGVFLMQQPQLAAGGYTWLVAVCASFTSSIALLGLHRLRHIDPRAIVVHFSGVSLVFCVVALFAIPGPVTPQAPFDGTTLWTLLGIGLSATGGQLLLTKSFAEGNPAKISVIGLTQVGFAMLFDLLFWDRTFGWTTLAGIGLVVAPTAWVMLRGLA
jgi:drug/metabolite transporter (DMT)-like permease